MTKTFGHFFVVLSSVISLRKQYIGVHKLLWHLLWNFWERFFRTCEVVKNKNFWKKAKFPLKKNIVAFFSSIVDISIVMKQFYMGTRR